MVENSNIYKTMRKKTQEEYITKYSIADFFKYKILIVQEHILWMKSAISSNSLSLVISKLTP